MPSRFGSDAALYSLRITHGDKTTHLRLPRALLLSLAIVAPLFLALAGTGAAWMIWRDEALQYLLTRQAHQQLDYEDRIASLRRQVDRVMADNCSIKTRSRAACMISCRAKQGLNRVRPCSHR